MAVLTLTASVPQTARVVHAVGSSLNLGRDATLPEVQDFLRNYLQAVVFQIERNDNNAALVQVPLGLT